jgi:hypothetical protein
MTGLLRIAAILAIALACTPGDVVHSQTMQPLVAPPHPAAEILRDRPDSVPPPGARAAGAVKVPIAFEQNSGQFEPRLAYLARAGRGTVGIGHDGTVTVSGYEHGLADRQGIAPFHLVRARSVQPAGVDRRPGRVRYLRGNDAGRWLQDVPRYRQVHLGEVYPGIDWEWNANDQSIEYDFIVQPGAEPRQIALEFGPSARLRVVGGDLNVTGPGGVTVHRRPVAYQERDGRRREVGATWKIRGSQARIALGRYDRQLPLVIDPEIAWSIYIGGPATDEASDVAVGADGSIFVSGDTFSAAADSQDAFIAKLTPGGALVYITYFGGSTTDFAPKIAVAGGLVYFAGGTNSTDFPMVAPAQSTSGGGPDGYAGALQVDGGFAFSTYLGGSAVDRLQAVAVAADGSAWMSGVTFSNDWHTVAPFQSGLSGQTDAVLVHLSAAGELLMSTYVGDTGCEGGRSLALAADGTIYLGGRYAQAVVTSTPPFVGCAPVQEGRLVKITPGGGAVAWSQLIVGTTSANAVIVHPDESIWVAGTTSSDSMPVTVDAYDFTCGTDGACDGTSDGFLSIRDVNGVQTYSTYLGGGGADDATALAVDGRGAVWVVGTTGSTDWPQAGAAQQDAFVVQFDGPTRVVSYAARFGGSDNDSALGVATSAQGAYVVGTTRSPSLPAQSGTLAGPSDVFLAHFAFLSDRVFIDHPANNARVLADLVVDGWAIDDRSPTGSGIDVIHMWAFSLDRPSNPPYFLGAAQYGLARGDVAAAYGARYVASGYRLAVSLPSAGLYVIGVYGRSTATGQFAAVRTVVVDAVDPAQITIEAPAFGAQVTAPLTVAGWALNPEAPIGAGTGVEGVDVWAFPVGGGSPVFVGAAFYGLDRPDIATRFGAQFRYSGFHITTSLLWAGRYTLAAYPRYTGTFRTGAPAMTSVEMVAGPLVWVDQPVGSTTVDQPFQISGWALDRRAPTGVGVDQVIVYAVPLNDGGGAASVYQYMGMAEWGMPRQDVADALGAQFVNCGYQLTINGLTPGFYRLGVYAHSTNPAPGAFPYFQTWTGLVEVR